MTSREFKDVTCACERCVDMCRRAPCQGTPEEMQAIIDAGLGSRLMLQYRENHSVTPNIEHVDYLAPAVKGHEGQRTPWWPSGDCTFLTDAGRCELHDKGLKPLEGRVVLHGMCDEKDDELFPITKGYSLRDHIATLWQNSGAQALVNQWRKEHHL